MKKLTVKNILLLAMYAFIAAVLIAGNIVYFIFQGAVALHLLGTGMKVDSEKAQETLAKGDELVQKIESEGIVLLKNDNQALPIKFDDKYNVNLFGVGSTDNGFTYSGEGSGESCVVAEDITENGVVKFAKNRVTLREGLESSGFVINADLLKKYNDGNPAPSFYNDNDGVLAAAKKFSSTAIVTISRRTGENKSPSELLDPKYDSLQLTAAEVAMVDYVKENFDKTIVLINSTNTLETGFLNDDRIDAALSVGATGQSGTKAIGKVLRGEVNPSGKTTETAPYDTTADPTFVNAVRTQGGNNQIFYAEDIYIGYKWYETADREGYFDGVDNEYGKGYDGVVQYLFGYGLSYTAFSWKLKSVKMQSGGTDEITLTDADGKLPDAPTVIPHRKTGITVTVEVKNNGDTAGKDVVQVYYEAPYYRGEIEKSYVNLVGFEKTNLIQPKETDEVEITFDVYDMASYDCYDKNGNGKKGWELDPGVYNIKIMRTAHHPSEVEDVRFEVPEFGTDGKRRGYVYYFDPDTNGYVKNRFTGDDAEAGMPIDANQNESNPDKRRVTYLSRADFAGTFPKIKPANIDKNVLAAANSYYYKGYDEAEKQNSLAMPKTGRTDGEMLYLYTRPDGSKASADELKRRSGIVPNEGLIMELGSDYNSEKWDMLLSQLDTSEIEDLVAAAGFGTMAMSSIGKPKFNDLDGPSGFNLKMASLLDASSLAFTGFPSNSVLACTWNKRLAYEMGFNEGDEAPVMGGINGWYAPTVNLQRTPYNTRNYEAYSEDGVLSGYMGAWLIKGASDNGLTCYLKHFALSEPGYNPNDLNTWLTEQNLRENYLKAFEICVKDGGANAVMSAFNRVGAVSATNSYALLTQVLRNEWKFRGSVVTDYNSGDVNSHVRSGNDLHLLPPNNAKQSWLDKFSSADVTVGIQAVKNTVYTYCNTYYAAKTYNPEADKGLAEMEDPFNWITLVIIILDVLCVAAIAFGVFMLFKPKKQTAVNGPSGDDGNKGGDGADAPPQDGEESASLKENDGEKPE